MDNFMDKLAERYNAQEMIRANAQAESTQMQSLQDQVEAYEAVLQEMRKLNYKNTELTEKMYSLVDESLEKVRTLQLQIESSGGAASTEAITRELDVTLASTVREALGSVDDTMAQRLTATLESALQQPTADLRQSTADLKQSTEDVRSQVAAVQSSADTMRSGIGELQGNIGEVKGGLETVYEEVQRNGRVSEEIRSAVSTILANQERQERSLAETALHVEREMPEAPVATSADLMEIKEKLDASAIGRQEIQQALQESAIGRQEIQQALRESAIGRQEIQQALQESAIGRQEIRQALQSIIDNDAQLRESLQATGGEIGERLFAIQQTGSNNEEALSAIMSAVRELQQQEGAREADASPQILSGLAGIQAGVDALRQPSQLEDLTQETLSSLAQAISQQKDTLTAVRASLDGIQSQVETTRAGQEQIAQSQAAAGAGSEEVRGAVADLVSSKAEILTQLRNIKASTDEGKTTLKSAVDSAVYGLKQDNKEMVEFLTRMNAAIANLNSDAEKAQREAEAQARAEEDRRAMEDRFKLTEDFMHKESVKVYRNVQAVINEKEDKRKEGLDNSMQGVEGSVKHVRTLALFSLIVGLINLVITVLSFLNIL